MTRCPYCGGLTKRITCGAAECQMSLNVDQRSGPAFQKRLAAYRNTPKVKARQKAYHASDEAKAKRKIYRAKEYVMVAERDYELTAKRRAKKKACYSTDEAKAKRRARYLRLKEAASDAAKLACIAGAWCAAWIIAAPSQARAAAMAVPEDSAVIPNAGLLFLALVLIGTIILLAIIAAIDRAKYGALERASLATRRARIERQNDEYAAAHRRGDGE